MDWNLAIERNREALKRIVAMLAAMAGLGDGQPAMASRQSHSAGSYTQSDCPLPIDDCRPHLPRHLHRTVLGLLRAAESAVRRLIIVAARGLVVPPARPRKPKPITLEPVLRGFGIAIVMSPSDFAGTAAAARLAAIRSSRPRIPSKGSLPLFDPLPCLPGLSKGRRYVPAHAAPRIARLDLGSSLHPLPAPPSPDDPIDATRLALRLEALVSALDDLPAHAMRFARRRGRDAAGAQNRHPDAAGPQNRNCDATGAPNPNRDAAGAQNRNPGRRWPLRPGRPPGQRRANRRTHEVHDILHDLHGLAFDVLERPDTS